MEIREFSLDCFSEALSTTSMCEDEGVELSFCNLTVFWNQSEERTRHRNKCLYLECGK